MLLRSSFFFFNDTATPEIYPLSLHDALPISIRAIGVRLRPLPLRDLTLELLVGRAQLARSFLHPLLELLRLTLHALVEPCLSQSDRELGGHFLRDADLLGGDRKSVV